VEDSTGRRGHQADAPGTLRQRALAFRREEPFLLQAAFEGFVLGVEDANALPFQQINVELVGAGRFVDFDAAVRQHLHTWLGLYRLEERLPAKHYAF